MRNDEEVPGANELKKCQLYNSADVLISHLMVLSLAFMCVFSYLGEGSVIMKVSKMCPGVTLIKSISQIH